MANISFTQQQDPFNRGRIAQFFRSIIHNPYLSWLLPIPVISKLIKYSIFPLSLPKSIQAIFGPIPPEEERKREDDVNTRVVTTKTFDGAELWGFDYKNKTESNKTILYFGGNAEDIGHDYLNPEYNSFIKQVANKLNANYTMFNYRNAGTSTGNPGSHKDLVVDGIAQVQRLINSGQKEITLYGKSIGGTVAARVMRYFVDHPKEGVEFKLIMDRSLSGVLKFLPKFLENILYWFSPFITSFNIGIEADLRAIPKEKILIMECKSGLDRVIPDSARLSEIKELRERAYTFKHNKVTYKDQYSESEEDDLSENQFYLMTTTNENNKTQLACISESKDQSRYMIELPEEIADGLRACPTHTCVERVHYQIIKGANPPLQKVHYKIMKEEFFTIEQLDLLKDIFFGKSHNSEQNLADNVQSLLPGSEVTNIETVLLKFHNAPSK